KYMAKKLDKKIKFQLSYLLCIFLFVLKLYSIAAFLYVVFVLISLTQDKKKLKINFISIKNTVNPIYLTKSYYKTQYYITDINKDRAILAILEKLAGIKDKISIIYIKYSMFFIALIYLVQENIYL